MPLCMQIFIEFVTLNNICISNHRKKKHNLGIVIGDEDEIVKDEIVNVNNGESILEKKVNKKQVKLNEEIKKANAEVSDKNIEVDVEGAEQPSTTPDVAKKVVS